MTERLYYHDSYQTKFTASVVDASPDSLQIYLNQTAFYPTSGGQPFDLGTLGGIEVAEIVDEGDRIAHILRQPLSTRELAGVIDWQHRFDHMQQHTGQHLLSAVLVDLFDAATVSFHLGAEASTIDISRALEPADLRRAELRANEIVCENRPVTVTFQHSSEDLNLRKATEREGLVRIVSIDGLDRSACGGTHVRATGEIGPILIRKLDRIRGNLRIEFLCGLRAVRRARADFEALSAIGRAFSAPLDETPGLVLAQREKLLEADRARQYLAIELAQLKGLALYRETEPDAGGIRKVLRRGQPLTEDLRAEAQSFASAGKAVFLAICEDPPSILIACSKDNGMHAGEMIKKALATAGGRGGGSATLAQASVTSKEGLPELAQALLSSV